MKKISLFGLSLLAVLFYASCATMPYQPYAREVKKKPQDGGVIALHTEHNLEDRAKADTLMRLNCANNEVKLLEEGEVVVGEEKHSTAQKTNGTSSEPAFTLGGLNFVSSKPSEDTTTKTTTTQVKEWHIAYQCLAKANATDSVAKASKKKKMK